MKIKVSDYVAHFLVEHGITNLFTVVGGGAMHLNDSFGHCKDIKCIYNHHEQASAIAAEAFARYNGKVAGVCVTSGPGAINTLNGVAGAYIDSIPMIVISGQAKRELTATYCGLKLRTYGIQYFDIVSTVKGMTKYAEMITDKNKIRYCLEKALYYAKEGRPGPSWLDIPVDVQGSYVETTELEEFEMPSKKEEENLEENIKIIIEKIKSSKRPVLYVGNGVRISGAVDQFEMLKTLLRVPVVTCWDSIDLIETEDCYYVGRAGTMGDRAGNFAVQNSDFLLCIGNRLSINQVGYDVKTWARAAYVVDVDIDSEEIKKPTIHVDLPICCDAKIFMNMLVENLKREQITINGDWIRRCALWKKSYPVVSEKHYENETPVNVYAFMNDISHRLPDNAVTVVANGSASVVGSQTYFIGKKQRFIMNCGLSSMGYDLPAAIGMCMANSQKGVICIAGDGSIQMNIQELQTIVTNDLPIKIFIINNGGYHQIRLTQKNIFGNDLIGVGEESGDLGFPDFEKIAYAYGYPYYRIANVDKMDEVIDEVITYKGYCICEVFCTTDQAFEPKSSTKRLEDGTLISPPLEDLAPFLSRKELKDNMYIELVD